MFMIICVLLTHALLYIRQKLKIWDSETDAYFYYILFWSCLNSPASALLPASTLLSRCRIEDRYHARNLLKPTIMPHIPSKIRPGVPNRQPFLQNGARTPSSVERNAGFLDDLFQGKFFQGNNRTDRRAAEDGRVAKDDPLFFSETDFRREVEKRGGGTTVAGST